MLVVAPSVEERSSFFSGREVFGGTVFITQVNMVNLVPALIASVENSVVLREERHRKYGVRFGIRELRWLAAFGQYRVSVINARLLAGKEDQLVIMGKR